MDVFWATSVRRFLAVRLRRRRRHRRRRRRRRQLGVYIEGGTYANIGTVVRSCRCRRSTISPPG